MKKEDLSKLKKGDKVCITMEAEVNGFVDDGETLSVRTSQIDACLFVHCSNVERGGVPRKFREGDIVKFCGYLREVEYFNPKPMLGLYNDGDDPEWVEADEVKLVCAVEDRADKKGGEA